MKRFIRRGSSLLGSSGAIGILALAGSGMLTSLTAQTVHLDTPDASFPDGFGMVQSVRELSDGRVLVADPLGRELMVLDMATGRRSTLSRTGRGPGEFMQPDAVWAFPGDSTLVVDLGNGRLTILDSELAYASSRPLVFEAEGARRTVVGIPAGVDARGNIYVKENSFVGGGAPSDSASVLRVGREESMVEQVAQVGLPRVDDEVGQQGGGRSVARRELPMSLEDAWGAAPDGRIVVARAEDYHLEWILQDGTIVRGPPVAHTRTPIRRREKEEWASELQRAGGGLNSNFNSSNGVTEYTFTRAASFGGSVDVDRIDFPDRKPAFYADRIEVDGLGRAWVRRHLPAGERPTYDVFDASGQQVKEVVLPLETRLVGFGDGTLYAVRFDEFDLAYVQRFSLPAS